MNIGMGKKIIHRGAIGPAGAFALAWVDDAAAGRFLSYYCVFLWPDLDRSTLTDRSPAFLTEPLALLLFPPHHHQPQSPMTVISPRIELRDIIVE